MSVRAGLCNGIKLIFLAPFVSEVREKKAVKYQVERSEGELEDTRRKVKPEVNTDKKEDDNR